MANLATLVVTLQADTKNFVDGLSGARDQAQGFAGKVGQDVQRIGGGALAAGAATAGVAITGLVTSASLAAKEAMSVESAFAGVSKTVDGLTTSEGELTDVGAKMLSQFQSLAEDVPTDITELMAIGELGGQLGVAREDLIAFSKSMADMSETTNLTSEQASQAFAKIANVAGTTERMGSEAWNALGSTVVELGNNMATTENDIVSMAQRFAAVGSQAGLTEADIMALAASASSVGVQAEAGGTALQKTIATMSQAVSAGGQDLEQFASVAGVSADNFATAFEEDAAGAMQDFLAGLQDQGDLATSTLDDLGLGGQRIMTTLLSMAEAGDTTAKAMDLANTAFADSTALQEEANKRYATTESRLKMVKNQFMNMVATVGGPVLSVISALLSAISPLITAFGEWLGPVLQKYVVPFIENKVVPAIQTFVTWLKDELPTAIAKVWNWIKAYLLPPLKALWNWILNSLVPAIRTFWNWLSEKLAPIFSKVSGNAELFRNVILAIAGAIAASAIIALIMGIVSAISAIASPVILIAALVGVLYTAWQQNWFGIRDTLQTAWTAMKQLFMIIKYYVTIWLPAKWETLKEKIKSVVATIKEKWQGFVDKIESAKTSISNAIANIKLKFLQMWIKIKTTVNNIKEKVQEFIDKIGDTLKDAVDDALDFFDDLKSGFENLISPISDVIDTLGDLWDKIINFPSSALEDILPGSPPPLARGLNEVAASIDNVNRKMPVMTRLMKSWGGLGLAGAPFELPRGLSGAADIEERAGLPQGGDTFNFYPPGEGGMAMALAFINERRRERLTSRM